MWERRARARSAARVDEGRRVQRRCPRGGAPGEALPWAAPPGEQCWGEALIAEMEIESRNHPSFNNEVPPTCFPSVSGWKVEVREVVHANAT